MKALRRVKVCPEAVSRLLNTLSFRPAPIILHGLCGSKRRNTACSLLSFLPYPPTPLRIQPPTSSNAMSSFRPHDSDKESKLPPPCAGFSSLPSEIRTIIIAFACSRERTVDLDYKTALSLALASRSMYALVTPILYRNVQLTRPSMLSDFLQAVSADPALGQLVRSLHVGPRQHLPDRWWPLGSFLGEREPKIMTSLEDVDLLPQWCCPRRRWPLKITKAASSREQAVLRAVNAAQRALGVDLVHPRHSPSGQDVGSLQWFIGVIEVGAALDLYLMEMRRLEDQARWPVPPWAGEWYSTHGPSDVGEPCPNYPPLLITTASSVPSNKGPKSFFVLPYAKVLDHLATRGSPTDFFDHPLICARSQLKVLDFDWAGQAHGSRLLFNDARRYRRHEADETVINQGRFNKAFELASVAFPHRIDAVPFLDVSTPLDVALARTSTVGGLISMVRSLLTLTPTLDNLFLAGFAQQVACELAAGPLPLRLLHLGPLTFRHEGSLDVSFKQARYPGMEKVFITGCDLYERKIASIVACAGSKTVFWSMRSPDLTLAT